MSQNIPGSALSFSDISATYGRAWQWG